MGTTQRLLPGVTGEPNWVDLNKSITNVSRNVEKEKNSENNTIKNPEEAAKQYKKLIIRRNRLISSVFKNLVKTGGGSKSISSGNSKSIGKAGLKSTGRLVSFFSGISASGLNQTLIQIGFGDLTGKTFQEVIDFLLLYCSDSSVGMDETAANKASCEVLNELAEQTGNDLVRFEELAKGYLEGNGLADLICKFWGLYIFEHLSQRFQEKITQQKGEIISVDTFNIIKDDIIGQVKVLNENRPVAKINWQGTEGKQATESIFQSIIKIISDEDNN